MTNATFSARLETALSEQRADRRTPEQIAADYRALAWRTLVGVKRLRQRGGWCGHMVRGSARAHLVIALDLAARYRRCAAKAHAEAKASARDRLRDALRETLNAA